MNIMHKLDKKIKTLIMITGEYPKEIEITKDDFEKLKTDLLLNQDENNVKYCGVKLKVIN